jgi:hypothetical protein
MSHGSRRVLRIVAALLVVGLLGALVYFVFFA